MKLEHRTENVVTFNQFLVRLARYGIFAVLLTICSVLMGTLGYHFIGGISWIDSIHMSCMILTGMGPTAEMTSTEAKLFSSFFALYSGLAFLTITAVMFSPLIHRILHILHVERDNE
jgi:hypothetical protein